MTATVLEVRRLTKRYENVIALNNVDLSVRKNEFVVVLGPSGSGKSTLLMAIAGFVKPDSEESEIIIEGRKVNDVPPYKRNVGVVFQSLALFPHMNVFENVAYPLKIRGLPKEEIKRRVKEMLEIVRLEGLEKRRIDELSGGQRQRVALARTLIFTPSILLLDEPLGALDRKLREEMQIEIKRIHEQVGATTLMVTHDQEEAMSMGDRIAVMRDGTIEQVGTPEEVYYRPKTRFVAEFMGRSNVLHGYARIVGNEAFFETSDGFVLRLNELTRGEGYVAIKPEKMKISKERGKTGLEGTIISSVFEGDHVRYEVKVGESMVRVIDFDTYKRYKVGEHVYLHVSPEDIVWIER